MRWILALAGMIATTVGCDELLCSGTVHTTHGWQGHELPHASLIAAGPATSAVVWGGGLSIVTDDRVIATNRLSIAAPRALSMAPDGSGIVVDGRMTVQVFDPSGAPGEPIALDMLAADTPSAWFDGTGFTVVWSVGQQVFLARVSLTGALVQGRTLIAVGAPDCPRVGPVAAGALDDHSAWIAWTAGSASSPSIVVARLVDGTLGTPRDLSITTLLPSCGGLALHGLAASGGSALVHVANEVIGLAADGTRSPAVSIGSAPVTLIGMHEGFALVTRSASERFPRDLHTRMRLLGPDGNEYLQVDVRGADGVYANAYGRSVAATGVDETVGDDGTSTLGVTRLDDDGQGTPVVLVEEQLAFVETSTCTPDQTDHTTHPQGGTY